MRVRQPRVHRRQTRLGAISDQDEYERELDDTRIQPGGDADQHCPAQANLAHFDRRSVIHQDGTHERQSNSDGGNNQVLICRFQPGMVVVKIHQEHGRKRCALNGDPHESKIVGCHRKQHGKDKQLKQGVKQSHLKQVIVIEFQPHVGHCV